MALTQFEKDCIDEIHDNIIAKDRPTLEDDTDLDTIKHGTEAARQTLLTNYINDTGLALVATEISAYDEETTRIAALKTAAEAKQTAMQAYVT